MSAEGVLEFLVSNKNIESMERALGSGKMHLHECGLAPPRAIRQVRRLLQDLGGVGEGSSGQRKRQERVDLKG